MFIQQLLIVQIVHFCFKFILFLKLRVQAHAKFLVHNAAERITESDNQKQKQNYCSILHADIIMTMRMMIMII